MKVQVVKSISVDKLLGVPVAEYIKKATTAVHKSTVDRSPHDKGFLRNSLGPGGGVFKITPTLGRVGSNLDYGLALDKPRSRNPHYLRGPHQGEKTAGWFEKGVKGADLDGMVKRLAAGIKGQWQA